MEYGELSAILRVCRNRVEAEMKSTNHLVAVAVGAFALWAISHTVVRAEVVLTGSELSGLGYSTGSECTSGCSSGFVSPNAVITTSDTVGGGALNQFNDTATITINNANSGAQIGLTLNALLAQGSAGNVSFDLASATNTVPGNLYAYWNVELSNSGNTIVVNAFSDNTLGTNLFDSGSCTGSTAACVSQGYENAAGSSIVSTFGESWATFAAQNNVDGTALGDWTVTALTISVGGWDSGQTHTDTIDSISLPGSAQLTPLPGALALVAGGLGMLGLLTQRRKRKGQASESRLAISASI
jgi:hypothetical protein